MTIQSVNIDFYFLMWSLKYDFSFSKIAMLRAADGICEIASSLELT